MDEHNPIQQHNILPEPTKINVAPEPTKVATNRKKTFTLRYVLMWVFSSIFIPCLIATLSIVIRAACDTNYEIKSYNVSSYIAIMTALLVFGGAYLALSFSCVKDFKNNPIPKYVRVMGIIYAVGFGITALAYICSIISLLLNYILGTDTYEESEILPGILTGVCAIIIILISSFEQLHFARHIPLRAFPTMLGVISLATIVSFFCIPVSRVRDAIYDEHVEDDLSSIDTAIRDYIDDYGKLPSNLNAINVSGLNNPITDYTFKTTSSSFKTTSSYSSYTIRYELCATFKTDTLDDSTYTYSSYSNLYSFESHSKGNYCFAGTKNIYD